MEAENKSLKENVVALMKEVGTLTNRIAAAPVANEQPKEKPEVRNGLYYFDGNNTTPHCPKCFVTNGGKHQLSSMRMLGHKCPICDSFFPR